MKFARLKKARHANEANSVLSKILQPVIRLLKASGVDDTSIFEAVVTACRAHRKERVRGIDLNFDRFVDLADVTMMWARDPEFVNEHGLPKKLGLNGAEPSFQRLLTKTKLNVNEADAISVLRELRAVCLCDKNRKVRLISHVLLSVTPNYFVVGAVLDEVRRFLETIEHNVCESPDPFNGRMQRTVLCSSLDPRKFPEAQRFIRQNAQAFLDSLDEKLSTCRIDKARHRMRYGAGIYVFVDKEKA